MLAELQLQLGRYVIHAQMKHFPSSSTRFNPFFGCMKYCLLCISVVHLCSYTTEDRVLQHYFGCVVTSAHTYTLLPFCSVHYFYSYTNRPSTTPNSIHSTAQTTQYNKVQHYTAYIYIYTNHTLGEDGQPVVSLGMGYWPTSHMLYQRLAKRLNFY